MGLQLTVYINTKTGWNTFRSERSRRISPGRWCKETDGLKGCADPDAHAGRDDRPFGVPQDIRDTRLRHKNSRKMSITAGASGGPGLPPVPASGCGQQRRMITCIVQGGKVADGCSGTRKRADLSTEGRGIHRSEAAFPFWLDQTLLSDSSIMKFTDGLWVQRPCYQLTTIQMATTRRRDLYRWCGSGRRFGG